MQTASSIRLVRGEEEDRRDRALREIEERQKDAPHGEKTIDPQPTGNYIPTDEILRRSYRQTDAEKQTS